MLNSTFQSLAAEILARPCPHKVRLIAVDGGAGAGKTTFADRLAAALGNAPVIPMDDFISWIDLERCWLRLEDQVLKPAFEGRAMRYQMRDWVGDMAGDGVKEWRELSFAPVLIFEGVGASRRALGERLHYAIWLDVPASERMERGIARDHAIEGIRPIWERWMPFEKAFLEKDRAWERANLIVDATAPFDQKGQTFSAKERS